MPPARPEAVVGQAGRMQAPGELAQLGAREPRLLAGLLEQVQRRGGIASSPSRRAASAIM